MEQMHIHVHTLVYNYGMKMYAWCMAMSCKYFYIKQTTRQCSQFPSYIM